MMTTEAGGTGVAGKPLRADAQRNRQRIIAAARELFAERGLDVSLDDVAAAAGVGVGTVYRRFTNRDELITAIFAQHLEDVTADTEDDLANLDPWSAVVTLATRVCTAMADDRGLTSIIMRIDHTDPTIAAVKSRLSERVTAVFRRARDAGLLRPDLTSTDFYGMFTMVSAYAELTEPVAPGSWRRYLELLLDAIHVGDRLPLSTPALTDDQIRLIQTERALRRTGNC